MVSLIIPMYNAENTIGRCINSIKNQIYGNWEAIIVDDASTDASESILKNLTKKDSRFHIYRTEKNSGPSAARNLALSKSVGDWILFIDSDDEIDNECLLSMVEVAEENNADIVMCGLSDIRGEKVEKYQKTFCEKERVFGRDEMSTVIKLLYTKEGEDGSACLNLTGPVAKLYNASIAKAKKFPENMRLGEDICYNRQVFDSCNKFVYFDKVLYFRYINEESLSYGVMSYDWKRKTDYVNWMIRYEKEEAEIKAGIDCNQVLYNCFSEFVCHDVHIVPKRKFGKIKNEITQCRKALIYEIDFSKVDDRIPLMVKCMKKGWYYLYKVLFVINRK